MQKSSSPQKRPSTKNRRSTNQSVDFNNAANDEFLQMAHLDINEE